MEKKKELILESAYNVLIDEGIEGLSMSKIAGRAKIPTSLIFHYFEGKSNLILELSDYVLRLYNVKVEKHLDMEGNITKEGFHKLVDLMFMIDFEESRLIEAYYACFYMGIRNEAVRDILRESVKEARNTYRSCFEQFAEKGIIHSKNIEFAIEYILSAVAGITKVADMEYGESSINQELVDIHKKKLFELLEFED